jgi:polyferredoxin
MKALLSGLALVALALAPVGAEGHGEHGGAAPLAGGGIVTVQGYEVELLASPGPLALGREHRLVARVLDVASGSPVTGGTVLLGVAPAPDGAASAHDPPPGRPATGAEVRVAPAPEVVWAGSYTAPFTPSKPGLHRVRVVLARLGGRPLDPPAVVDFSVTVGPAPGLGPGVWLLLATLVGAAGLGLHAAAARARSPAPAGSAPNLLEVPWIGGLLRSNRIQPALQGLLLTVGMVVVYLGLTDVQEGGINLATKLTWTIWWAGIIFTFFLVGRAWCFACPFGALNEWCSRLAGATRRLPRLLRNLWWATGLFVALTWADEQLGVVRSPAVTAGLVVFFALFAAGVGLAYQRRSFCRYLCPIGGVIGLYSMVAPLELRAGDAATCAAHREKACYRGSATGRGCPMFEFPQAMDRNTYCNLCGECVKACSRGNLVLRVRAFGKDLWAAARGSLDEAYLAALLVGLTSVVTAQMLTGWAGWVSAAARWLPPVVRTNLKPVTYLGAVESALLVGAAAVAAPAFLLAAAWASNRAAGGGGVGVRRTFVAFAYALIPVGLAMHLAHNLSHLLLEGRAVVPALQRAILEFTPFSLGRPDWHAGPLADPGTVAFLQYAVVALFFLLSLVAGHRIAARLYAEPHAAVRAAVPVALLALGVTVVNVLLLAQPMGMRHGM